MKIGEPIANVPPGSGLKGVGKYAEVYAAVDALPEAVYWEIGVDEELAATTHERVRYLRFSIVA